jgi:Uma2 family endonuclease
VAKLDPDEHPGELDAGTWIPMTRNTWRHGRILINAGTLLRLYARANPEFCVAGGDPGTKLRRDPDTLRGPDVGVIRRDREPSGRGEAGWLEGAPDVAIEIAGDAQSVSDLNKKALEYLASGARVVWVIDPDPQRVLVFLPPDRVRILSRGDILDGGEVLPGFSCQVSELFE